jgi:hypothetical protein
VLSVRRKRNKNVLTSEADVKREEARRPHACVGVLECPYGSFMRKGRISDKNNRKTEDIEAPSEEEPMPPADGSRNEFNENVGRSMRFCFLLFTSCEKSHTQGENRAMIPTTAYLH